MNVHLYEEIQSVEDLIKDTIRDTTTSRDDRKRRKDYKLGTEDPYTTMMKKEDKVLNMLNDYRKSEDEKQSAYKYFLTSPIHVVLYKTIRVISNIVQEMMDTGGSPYDLVNIVTKKDNIVYVGITLVFVSILLMFVNL